jgi:hypothetical protein
MHHMSRSSTAQSRSRALLRRSPTTHFKHSVYTFLITTYHYKIDTHTNITQRSLR